MNVAVYHKISLVGLIVLLASGKASSTNLAGWAGLYAAPSNLMFTTLAWDASPGPGVAGYAVYYQVDGLAMTNRVDAGNALTVTIPMLVGSAYSIFVVAYTEDAIESEPSNLLRHTPPPLTPVRLVIQDGGTLQIRFRTSPLAFCQVEWTDDLTAPNWQPWVVVRANLNGDVVLTDAFANDAPARFYRASRL